MAMRHKTCTVLLLLFDFMTSCFLKDEAKGSLAHAWELQRAAGCEVRRSWLQGEKNKFLNICCFFVLPSFPPTFAAYFSQPSAPHLTLFFFLSLSHSLLQLSPSGQRPLKRRSTFPICCLFEVRPPFPQPLARNLSFLSSFTLHLLRHFLFSS